MEVGTCASSNLLKSAIELNADPVVEHALAHQIESQAPLISQLFTFENFFKKVPVQTMARFPSKAHTASNHNAVLTLPSTSAPAQTTGPWQSRHTYNAK